MPEKPEEPRAPEEAEKRPYNPRLVDTLSARILHYISLERWSMIDLLTAETLVKVLDSYCDLYPEAAARIAENQELRVANDILGARIRQAEADDPEGPVGQ